MAVGNLWHSTCGESQLLAVSVPVLVDAGSSASAVLHGLQCDTKEANWGEGQWHSFNLCVSLVLGIPFWLIMNCSPNHPTGLVGLTYHGKIISFFLDLEYCYGASSLFWYPKDENVLLVINRTSRDLCG